MFRSIRWSLFGWHSLLLLLVLATFGGLLYSHQERATFERVDADLVGMARLLGGGIQKKPPQEKNKKKPFQYPLTSLCLWTYPAGRGEAPRHMFQYPLTSLCLWTAL